MFKFLKYIKDDTWVDTALVIVIRLMVTGFTIISGYLLAFAATMGPPIAPYIWNGNLDFGIRISIIIIGFGLCAAVVIWFVWTLCCDIYRIIIRTK